MVMLPSRAPKPAAPVAKGAVDPPPDNINQVWVKPEPELPIPPEKRPEALPVPKAAAEPVPINDDQLKKMLGELRLPRKVGEAVAALAELQPDDKRAAEVVTVLAEVARSADLNPFVRADASRTLGRWKTPESLAALMDAVNDSSTPVRHAAIEGLASFGTEQAAFAIVRRLSEPLDRGHSSSLLQGMGSVAERAVGLGLRDANSSPEVRLEACRILGEVGTAKSVPVLDSATTADPNPQVRAAAANARARLR
jgi:HEAT repeat protein